MDTQTLDFTTGTSVIYGMHGKCCIKAIENRTVDNQSIPFYKLEVLKSTLSRSSRQDPAIWVPVDIARERGMRPPVNRDNASVILAILADREYYFSVHESWHLIKAQLEHSIRTEGAIGLAKVASYLFVLKRQQIVPSTEVARMDENVMRLLLRELSEATGEPITLLEEKINKGFRSKTLPDN